MISKPVCLLICLAAITFGCAPKEISRRMVVTGYCNCGQCCGWERGSRQCLGLDVWNRYVSVGPAKGTRYSGLTASGTKPRTPKPGLFSKDSLARPWMIPLRIVFFPWLLLPRDGTLAADTVHYPFGTRFYIPGWGYGVVEDRGGAIKGPERLDAYFRSHQRALEWGRQTLYVRQLE